MVTFSNGVIIHDVACQGTGLAPGANKNADMRETVVKTRLAQVVNEILDQLNR